MSDKKNTLSRTLHKISLSSAIKLIICLLSIALFYHFLIITGIISYEAAWGGRLENKTQMYRFETFSIVLNLFILLVVCLKGQIIKNTVSGKLLKFLFYALTVLFALNTVGNIFSENIWEAIIFTPLTFVLAILFARLAID